MAAADLRAESALVTIANPLPQIIATDRRDFLTADPISAYNAAFTAFNDGDPTSEDAYIDALQRMDDYTPTTDRDFVRKFIAMWKDGGYPNQDRIDDMLANGILLVGEA